MTTVSEQRFINNRNYAVVTIDGTGGRTVIQPGEVVGAEFANMMDMKKGLVPYNGPRSVGPMQRVGLATENPSRPPARGHDQIPGIAPPRVEGAMPTEMIPGAGLQTTYMGKSQDEWAGDAAAGKIAELSRGSLLGLAQHMGINLNAGASKKDILSVVTASLQAVALANKVNQEQEDTSAPANSPTKNADKKTTKK